MNENHAAEDNMFFVWNNYFSTLMKTKLHKKAFFWYGMFFSTLMKTMLHMHKIAFFWYGIIIYPL
jgi:hypothetical protein